MVDINNKKSIALLYEDVRTHLLNAVLSFWYEHTRDTVNGGYTTALDRTGKPLKSEREKNASPPNMDVFQNIYRYRT